MCPRSGVASGPYACTTRASPHLRDRESALVTAEVRAALEQLVRVLRAPTAGFTGSVQVTIHFHSGTAGKVAMAQTWNLVISDVDKLPEWDRS
jgi:hypothetical protein